MSIFSISHLYSPPSSPIIFYQHLYIIPIKANRAILPLCSSELQRNVQLLQRSLKFRQNKPNINLLMSHNPEEYLNNVLNTSISKFTHAFSKAERFSLPRKLQTQVKYNIPSTFDTKGCGFGYGSKMSMIIKRCSPPPGTYESISEFRKDRKKLNTPSIALGRELVQFGSYLTEAQKKGSKVPSPNKYDIHLPRSHIGGKMGIRLQTDPGTKRSRDQPGPGAYNLQATEMANSSSFILSTFKKSVSPRYHDAKTIEFARQQASNSILCYDIQEKEFGKSKTSKFRNVSVSSFSKSRRDSIVDKSKLNVPGFKYKIFSEFGQIHK